MGPRSVERAEFRNGVGQQGFESELQALAVSAVTRNDAQMAFALAKIMREVGDGHSYAAGGGQEAALTIPVQFHPFPEGLFVVAADPKHRDLLGAQVLEYGGRPIAEVMSDVAETVSRDNESGWVQLQVADRLRRTALMSSAGVSSGRGGVTLKVRGLDGENRSVWLTEDLSQPDIWNQKPYPQGWLGFSETLPGTEPPSLRNAGKHYWFEHLPTERTVIFGLNTLRDDKAEALAAFSDRLAAFLDEHSVKRLVIDLRWNNGGNTALFTPVLAAVLRSKKVNRPGGLFVLIGGRTFSAAQNAASLLDRFTEAVFVGEPTGSSPNFIGENSMFTLPYSKVRVSVSNLAWQSSLPQDRRTWIAPLIYTPPTFAAYRANRDPAMEAVLALPVSD